MHVVSAARKLILRPPAGAPVVAFQEGAIVNDYGVNNQTPSVVVRNGTEAAPSWQGVDHETGVVIVNEVPEEVAEAALDTYSRHDIDAALAFLAESGCVDQYTTKLGFVDTKLSPAGRMLDRYTGIVKRDDRDLTPLWREGDVYYTAPSGQGRVIEPDILLRTYRNPDGSAIDLTAIPEGRPEGVTG